MANYEVISQKPIHSSHVLDQISKRADSRELTYREEKVMEYLNDFNKLSVKDTISMYEELKKLDIVRLEDVHLIKIMEIMPSSGTELRTIVSHGGVVVVDETVNQILDIVKKYQ